MLLESLQRFVARHSFRHVDETESYWGGLERCAKADVERWRVRGQAALDVMERHLAERRYFVGERYGIADIALFAYTQSAEALGSRVGPAVTAWLARVGSEPGHVPIARL